MSRSPTTSSFTALELAPGVLKTTTPCSAKRSWGMLFTPAPARATQRMESGTSMSWMSVERMRMASAPFASSTIS